MAFITYRASTTPTLATATTLATGQLTNLQIDANFKALDAGKLETNGSAASLTGLPLTTGVTGILPVANGGTGSSTASTGSGGVVLATSPTLVTANLGTPAYLNLTNAINFPLDGTATVTGKLPIAFGGTNATATPTAGAVPYGTGTAYAFTGVGTTGQVLTSAGAGTPTWTTVTTSAGGSNTQLQYNSSGSFAGSANMTFNGTTLALNSLSISTTLGVTGVSTLTGGAVIQGLTVGLGANAVANNTAVGANALASGSLSGNSNTALGSYTLVANTTGIGNTALGQGALNSNLVGNYNVGVGQTALGSNTGTNNLALGYSAGSALTSGSNNTIIGSVAGTAGLANTVIIAAGAAERLRVDSAGKMITLGQVETPDVTSLLTTANTYPTTRPSLNLDFANSATLDPRITFTRGTNATYTGSDGLVKNTAGINSPRFDWDPVTRECKGLLIEEARTNLLTYSNDMDKGNWGVYAPMLTAIPSTVLAPNGTYSAYSFNTTNGGSCYQDVTGINGTNAYTGSIYISKLSTCTNLIVTGFFMGATNENFGGATINPQTAVNTTTSSYTITDLGNNWLRVTFTKTGTYVGNTAIRFQIYNNTSSASNSIIAWGAQMEAGAFATSYIPSSVTWTGRASTATYVGSNGLIQTAASGVARYQYNPTNLSVAPFLLLEPAATNLLPYSEQFDNVTWSKSGTLTSNVTTAPDGTNTADKVVEAVTNQQHLIVNTIGTVSIGSTYTFSLYAKLADTRNVFITCHGETYYAFNLSTGALISGTASNATTTQLSNGWWRFTATFVKTNVTGNFYIGTWNTASSYTGDGTSGIYIWGAQVETGSVATSYIPTVASQVTRIADTSTSAQTTRSADVATMTNSNFSSWYNQTEGTIVSQADNYAPDSVGYNRVWQIDDATNSNELVLCKNNGASSAFIFNSFVQSVYQFGTTSASISANTTFKGALAYIANNYGSSFNGAATQTGTGSIPVVNRLNIGNTSFGGASLNGHIKRLTYYPTRLSNSTLQALTT